MRKAWILALVFLLVAHQASAVALGVNKARVNFVDVLRGGYAETTITVSTDSAENISLEYEFTGDLEDWMRLVPNNESELIFSRDNPLRLRIIAEPPGDAANDVYDGELRLLTGGFSEPTSQYGSTVRASFGVDLNVAITGEQIVSCTAGGFDIVDTETGFPLELHATVQNTGNVRLQPEFEVDVWDQYQTRVVLTDAVTAESEVLPTTQNRFIQSMGEQLPVGQYWAQIREPTCEDSQMITFNVVELGGISDRGELLRIDHEPWVETGDIIRVAAVFKNLGSRVVNAKFKGTIEKDGRTVEVIDTDSLNVRPGETTHLESFFNPTEPGRYAVQGRVIYNSKLTFEKSSQINVQGAAPRVTGNAIQRVFKNPYQVSMVFIVLVIGVLLFLIRKEKKKRRF